MKDKEFEGKCPNCKGVNLTFGNGIDVETGEISVFCQGCRCKITLGQLQKER